jgi:hypothetical protein
VAAPGRAKPQPFARYALSGSWSVVTRIGFAYRLPKVRRAGGNGREVQILFLPAGSVMVRRTSEGMARNYRQMTGRCVFVMRTFRHGHHKLLMKRSGVAKPDEEFRARTAREVPDVMFDVRIRFVEQRLLRD